MVLSAAAATNRAACGARCSAQTNAPGCLAVCLRSGAAHTGDVSSSCLSTHDTTCVSDSPPPSSRVVPLRLRLCCAATAAVKTSVTRGLQGSAWPRLKQQNRTPQLFFPNAANPAAQQLPCSIILTLATALHFLPCRTSKAHPCSPSKLSGRLYQCELWPASSDHTTVSLPQPPAQSKGIIHRPGSR